MPAGSASSATSKTAACGEERERSDLRLAEERELSAARLADERTSAEELRAEEAAERIQTARKVAIRNVVAELAPFIGMDLYRQDLDVHPYLVDLRIAAMALVDEYPVEHPINELVGYHQHLGMSTARAIQEDTVARERAAVDIEDRLVALGPMHRWAAQYTADMRSILVGNVTDDQMRARSREVAGTTAALYERNGWESSRGRASARESALSDQGAMLCRMPHLIRCPAGWTYPPRPPCPCGDPRAWAGWRFCRCETASGGGHPERRCKGCGAVDVTGCAGEIPVLNEYGGRRPASRR